MKQSAFFIVALVATAAQAIQTSTDQQRRRFRQQQPQPVIEQVADNEITISQPSQQLSDDAIFHWFQADASNHRDEDGRFTFRSGYTEEIEAEVLADLNARKAAEPPCDPDRDPEDFSSDAYQSQTAYCKLQQVWAKVKENDDIQDWFVGGSFRSTFEQDMTLTYTTVSDILPPNRQKKTHGRGVTTQVQFIAQKASPYTGCFRGGSYGVMRISEFVRTTPDVLNTVPGYGLKLFRDGKPSCNMVAMHKFDGQTTFNFFANRWTNMLKEMDNTCVRNTLGKKLSEVSKHIGATSTLEWSQCATNGEVEENPHNPFEVLVVPHDIHGWSKEFTEEFHIQLPRDIAPNTLMFKLYAIDHAKEHDKVVEQLIGWIVSRSETVTSLWGDTQLFFQHQSITDDIKLRPYYSDWVMNWTLGPFIDGDGLTAPVPYVGCPFQFLFEEAGLVEGQEL